MSETFTEYKNLIGQIKAEAAKRSAQALEDAVAHLEKEPEENVEAPATKYYNATR